MSKTELTMGIGLNPTEEDGDIVYQFKLQPGNAWPWTKFRWQV